MSTTPGAQGNEDPDPFAVEFAPLLKRGGDVLASGIPGPAATAAVVLDFQRLLAQSEVNLGGYVRFHFVAQAAGAYLFSNATLLDLQLISMGYYHDSVYV